MNGGLSVADRTASTVARGWFESSTLHLLFCLGFVVGVASRHRRDFLSALTEPRQLAPVRVDALRLRPRGGWGG